MEQEKLFSKLTKGDVCWFNFSYNILCLCKPFYPYSLNTQKTSNAIYYVNAKAHSQSYSHFTNLISLLAFFVMHDFGNGKKSYFSANYMCFSSVSCIQSWTFRYAGTPSYVAFCLQLYTDTHAYMHMQLFQLRNLSVGQKTMYPMKYDRTLCQLPHHFWCNGRHQTQIAVLQALENLPS